MRYNKVEDLPRHLQDQARKKIEGSDNPSLSSSNLEPAVRNAALGQKENKGLDSLLNNDRNRRAHGDGNAPTLFNLENHGSGEKRSNRKGEKNKANLQVPQYCLHVHSKRYRATDSGGVSDKAAIDGFIRAGILPNDSPEFIPEEITHTREKCKKGEEKTIIEMWEI